MTPEQTLKLAAMLPFRSGYQPDPNTLAGITAYIDELIALAVAGHTVDRDLPVTQKWLLQTGWMQIFNSDDESFFFTKGIDSERRLEIHALSDPITLTRVDDDYYWTGLCQFKNDGTRGPIMDLLRILDL